MIKVRDCAERSEVRESRTENWSRPEVTQRSNECACVSHARAILARVGMDYTISIEISKRQNAADLNFAVFVFISGDKAKTKQLRFLH